ncbi:MAG: hypothetical protein ACRDRU_28625 [Pseudonocardiaceae bacterium]
MAGEGLAAGSFHLISHHEVRWTGRITPRYYALCGARMDTGDGVGERVRVPERLRV